ncbi:type II secretion system secretin GspD [Hyphomicrobium sp.]|uniref:type II secretion system secretin GspD n=1 Tax=Hyphomicrobium sp. TaxID=82 RepID=UPI002E30D196|nr:type II secretion system secretin GspD [Hyphomicrobium sp.]HEX2840998.1 type II secretion system secretin GspD [Hyphomicrobium sp.]
MVTGAIAAVLSIVLSACTLPMEQLSLPSPITPTETGAIPAPPGGGAQGSAPLGSPGDPAASQPRAYPGSGSFVNPAGPRERSAVGTVTGEGVSLDLVDASIAEAARAVLGDVLHVTYVVSDKLKGSITLKTANPVSQDALLDVFESVLETEGAAIVIDGGVYKVLPRDEAVAAGKHLKMRASPARRVAGMSSEIVPLTYVSATEMERILKSVAPQSTIARVDTARNLLILTGTKAELASLVETVATFDVDWLRGMSFGLYPVESDTEAIAQELDTIFANDQESPTKGMVRFVPNARLKAILVISSKPQYLQKAETWIKRIDMAGQATEKRAFVYHVQYRPVQELALLLQKLYGPEGQGDASADNGVSDQAPGFPASQTIVSDDQSLSIPPPTVGQRSTAGTPGAFAAPLIASAGGAPGPQAAPPGAAEAPDGDAAAEAQPANRSGMLAQAPPNDRQTGISIVADDSNNSLIISATPGEIRRIKQVLAEVDRLPSQVLLEATIAEVTLNDNLRFGLRWFFESGRNEFRLTDSALGAIAPVFPGFSYFVNAPNAKIVLNALANVTNVDVVSSPSLMVLNNKKAVLQIGDEVPVATQSAVSVLTPDAPIVNAIAFRNTGVILNIIPRVAEDGRVLLEIEQEVSDVKPTTSSSIDSPTIQQRRIKTTVAVQNGGSVMLAGLMQDRASRERKQVPLAGDIPLVGNLFKDKDDRIQRTELLIAITPHVVTDDGQMGRIAAEFRDRLNLSTRPQRATPPDRREQVDRIVR